MIELADKWLDYQLIDAGDKDKLEKWGDVVLVRPDPQAIWRKHKDARWNKYDAIYNIWYDANAPHRSNGG